MNARKEYYIIVKDHQRMFIYFEGIVFDDTEINKKVCKMQELGNRITCEACSVEDYVNKEAFIEEVKKSFSKYVYLENQSILNGSGS
ncbi:hypothetical protein [Acetobacter sp. UBA5411]|uniref:hypothetical protein n=1 Tax=Acetobacter sp. UBA5411 TaxID=1945905 RepID=UPI0025C032E8|nr:hypothetical protein [Acetobacter sp. UBA5411]